MLVLTAVQEDADFEDGTFGGGALEGLGELEAVCFRRVRKASPLHLGEGGRERGKGRESDYFWCVGWMRRKKETKKR